MRISERDRLNRQGLAEQAVCSAICRSEGIKARQIARELELHRSEVNRLLYNSPLMKELCWKDEEDCWHGLVSQAFPHSGLHEICAYSAEARDFLALSEEAWLAALLEGCRDIGRNVNDSRGLIHSFTDCRLTMRRLFTDLEELGVRDYKDWVIAFELKLKHSKWVRIYADVLVITPEKLFSLEFKMKEVVVPEEVQQAAKYVPYLEILFGPDVNVVPALVLTKGADLYTYTELPGTTAEVPVCSGDMLFNLFDEYLRIL